MRIHHAVLALLLATSAMAGLKTWPPEADRGAEGATPVPPPATCPCYTDAAYILSVGATCAGTVNPTCIVPPANPAYLRLDCDPGGVVPPGIIGIYALYDSTNRCTKDDINESGVDISGLTADQKTACANALTGSYCF